jgi:hypothetical protein
MLAGEDVSTIPLMLNLDGRRQACFEDSIQRVCAVSTHASNFFMNHQGIEETDKRLVAGRYQLVM